MRTAPHSIGSILHVTQRGVRGNDIVHDAQDRDAFIRGIRFVNDSHIPTNWRRDTAGLAIETWPDVWPEQKPLVRVLGWTLLPNHFHLILEAVQEGGIPKFMQRFCGSLSASYNARYGTTGSLFQGGYKSVLVEGAGQFQYLIFYVLVKNVLDAYPGGLVSAAQNFDAAWEWAKTYRFSSFGEQIARKSSPLVEDLEDLVAEVIGSEDCYKKESRELLAFHLQTKGEDFNGLMLEPW